MILHKMLIFNPSKSFLATWDYISSIKYIYLAFIDSKTL